MWIGDGLSPSDQKDVPVGSLACGWRVRVPVHDVMFQSPPGARIKCDTPQRPANPWISYVDSRTDLGGHGCKLQKLGNFFCQLKGIPPTETGSKSTFHYLVRIILELVLPCNCINYLVDNYMSAAGRGESEDGPSEEKKRNKHALSSLFQRVTSVSSKNKTK